MVQLARVAHQTLARLEPRGGEKSDGDSDVFYRSLEWSADGTCLIATTNLNTIDILVVPQDLLAQRNTPLELIPTTSITSAGAVRAVLGHPDFNLQDTSTMLVLSSVRDHPIRLGSAFTTDLIASYPLVNSMTEEYITPHSLVFHPKGGSFVAGSDSRLSFFDLSRPGEIPMSSLSTKNRFNPAASQSGIVSALVMEPNRNLLAAGTFARSLGLYEAGGQGECIAAFSLRDNEADKHIGGTGITQVQWSSCGNYLYVAERKSDGIMVYLISERLASFCVGLREETLGQTRGWGMDVTQALSGSQEVWAGSVDEKLRMWKDAHTQEGPLKPQDEHDLYSGESDIDRIRPPFN